MQVQAELDALAAQRLLAPLTPREQKRWEHLIALEEDLMHRGNGADV